MTPPDGLPPPRTLHPQLIGAEGDERRGEHGGEGALSIKHCHRNDPGDDAPVRYRGYRMLLPGHSVEQTKVSCIHRRKNIKGNNLLKVIYIIYIKEDRNPK